MSSFRFGSFRRGSPLHGAFGGRRTRKLERANTVATGLGQQLQQEAVRLNEQLPVKNIIEDDITRANSGGDVRRDSLQHRARLADDSEKLHHFCRGSIKRLKHAESKLSLAKRDMEEIIELAKSDGDLNSIGTPPMDLDSLDASKRLANDSRLAIEAQLEMRKIIHQFASLLQEEEDKVAFKADLLQRRSSQIHFDYSVPKRDVISAAAAAASPQARRLLKSAGSELLLLADDEDKSLLEDINL